MGLFCEWLYYLGDQWKNREECSLHKEMRVTTFHHTPLHIYSKTNGVLAQATYPSYYIYLCLAKTISSFDFAPTLLALSQYIYIYIYMLYSIDIHSIIIKICRFLGESNCVGMCLNLYKNPSQKFIKESLGMPVNMVPSKYSCILVFKCNQTYTLRN